MDDTDPDRRRVNHPPDAAEWSESGGGTRQEYSILTRRSVLASITAIGTAGALSGAGIRAALEDEEPFGNNTLQSGELDLGLAWETYYDPVDGDRRLVDSAGDCGDAGSGRFIDDSRPAITLKGVKPGDAGETNICLQAVTNPGWLWIGASCPEGGLENAIDASLTFDLNCDGSSDVMIPASTDETEETSAISGSLCEVLRTLSGGVQVGDSCVTSNESHCLTLSWEFPEPVHPGQFARYEGSSVEIVIEFLVEQCRHNDEPTNPIGRACPEDSCEEVAPAISWIAFCVDEGELSDGDVAFEVVEESPDGEPIAVAWDAGSTQMSTVVVYYGSTDSPSIENFFVDDGTFSGTVSPGDGDERTSVFEDADQSPSDPCPAGGSGIKYEWEDGAFHLEA